MRDTFSLVWITVVTTLLRMLPFPARTGVVRIGDPGRDAPVVLTANFRLTVARVKRALRGLDIHLLVADSRGVNVWCAATGGLFTTHDVISVLETSGVGDLVDHRQVILPQLAATGIEGKEIQRRAGWRVVWGPVYAAALPAFLRAGLETTPEMRAARFPWTERLEMAVAWAFPISLLALLLWPFRPGAVLPLMGLVWGFSLLLYASFPLYESRLRREAKRVGFVFFDFGRRGVLLLVWLAFVVVLVLASAATGSLSWGSVLPWALASLVVLLILGLDLMGSTPVYKSGLHEDRRLVITLDPDLCRGAAFCEQVCPKDVFDVDHTRRLATLPRREECVQCGACIVQCPFDALWFRSPTGSVVTPETVRRYKLNLLGSRQTTASA